MSYSPQMISIHRSPQRLFSTTIHPTDGNCSPNLSQQQPEFSNPDSSLVFPVFAEGDIRLIKYSRCAFLTAVVTFSEHNFLCSGTTRKYTYWCKCSNTGKPRTLLLQVAKGERRKRHILWQIQEHPEVQNHSQTVITSAIAFIKTDNLDAYDSDCDEINSAKFSPWPISSRMDRCTH
ncbi:hypothetical protein Tco_0011989 [Tanacetum coccineum]